MGLGAVLLVGGYLYVRSLKAEMRGLEAQLAYNQATVKSLTLSVQANQKALEIRARETQALAREKDAALAALREVYKTDAEACAWSEEKIPDSVLEALGCL
jgi:hypothetical protein